MNDDQSSESSISIMNTPSGFAINFVFLAYVPPYYEFEEILKLQTIIIRKSSKTTEYLFKIFDSAIAEARIEILFNSNGEQNNIIRNEILSIVKGTKSAQKIASANKLAKSLYEVTDERNGTGLFVVIAGKKARSTRIVLIRFKGDEGLYSHGRKLSVDYVSEMFTRRSNHYKLAVYEDIISDRSFWKGFSIDRQISGNTYKSISFFWVEAFLNSKTALTPAQGTLQFSKVIKTILSKTSDISEQEQIISGIVNLRSKKGVQMSVVDFCKNYLSDNVSARIMQETNEDFFNSVFTVDGDVYQKEFGKTVLSLDGGITAYIPTFTYNKHVSESISNDGSKKIIIESKLQSKKINVQPKQKHIK